MEFFAAPTQRVQAILRANAHPDTRWSPGAAEAWWWLGLPLATAAGVLAIYRISPELYLAHILPEGYGALEFSQFILLSLACFICLRQLGTPAVQGWSLVRTITLLFAVGTFYIAGEEMSWGQHLFGWGTPEAWGEINRQNETNLHNTAYVFNQLPQLILEIGIVAGGVVLPLVQRITGPFTHWFLALFTAPFALLPGALLAFCFKGLGSLQNAGLAGGLLLRPSETTETLYYMFILFYSIVFARRLAVLAAPDARSLTE